MACRSETGGSIPGVSITLGMEIERKTGTAIRSAKVGILSLGVILVLMWVVQVLDLMLFGGGLYVYGILPRSVDGLDGIILAPFLHAGVVHLAYNSIPFVLFGSLVWLDGPRKFVVTTLLSLLGSGLGVWLLGAPDVFYVVASGVIFGHMGYLLLRGYFDRSVRTFVVAIILVLVYGGALLGILPLMTGSWEPHLFGFLGGAYAAYLFRGRGSGIKK